ncbi:MAG TPA: decarboxylating 6-phosphogluconate dehydrogenase [Gemmatales bacterium]|nr:decarboxylating 6-phosphogluconate dehydrogenase [Gemmatales bacterium]
MQLGMIGLGRMGGNMVRRLLRAGHTCVVYDASPETTRQLAEEGARAAASVADLVQQLTAPRAVWIMLPAGEITENCIAELHQLLQPGDMIIDGGNTNYHDDLRRAKNLASSGIHYVDVGTSGGVWGLERGYCLMIGGPAEAVVHLEPVFRSLAPGAGTVSTTAGRDGSSTAEMGYIHAGPSGAGHFVKMVHNGIEYGMMQAFAEGFDLMHAMQKDNQYHFNLAEIAEVWRRGSVVSSWLLDLIAKSLVERPALDGFTGQVNDSGEGRWTIETAIEQAVPGPVLSQAVFTRFRSRSGNTFGEKLLSAMRYQFGGHVESTGKST